MEEGGRCEGQNFQQLKKVQRLEEEEEQFCVQFVFNSCFKELFSYKGADIIVKIIMLGRSRL